MVRWVVWCAAVVLLAEGCASPPGIQSELGLRPLDLESSFISGVPEPRMGAGLAYVPDYDFAFLHGGVGETGDQVGDSWIYDVATSTWWQVGEGPPASAFPAVAYDRAQGLIVVVVGYGEDGGSTWTFDPSSGEWERREASVELLVGDLITYHPDLGTVLLVDEHLRRLDLDEDRWVVIEGSQITGFDQHRDGAIEVSGFLACEGATGDLYAWGARMAWGDDDPSTVFKWSDKNASWTPLSATEQRREYEGAAGDLITDKRSLIVLSLDLVQTSEGSQSRIPSLWIHDLDSAEWSKLSQTDEPNVTAKPGLAYIPTLDQLLVVGGFTDESRNPLAAAWLLDPQTGAWSVAKAP